MAIINVSDLTQGQHNEVASAIFAAEAGGNARRFTGDQINFRRNPTIIWFSTVGVTAGDTLLHLHNGENFSDYDLIAAEFISGGDNHLTSIFTSDFYAISGATEYITSSYQSNYFRLQRAHNSAFRFRNAASNIIRLHYLRGIRL